MIKITATALVHSISQVINVTDTFQKRELVLNDSWQKDGVDHPNFVSIEWVGERMALLDGFMPGQRVTVEAAVNGREYNGRFFNTIRGLSITPFQPQQQGYQQPAYPQQPQQPAYPQQQGGGNPPF